MKAITIHRPWANLIAVEAKKIETRTHDRFRSLEGHRIAIHASKTLDRKFPKALAAIYSPSELKELLKWINGIDAEESAGCVVAFATVEHADWLVDTDKIRRRAMCPVDERFGLWLDDVYQLEVPVPITGQQGIWNFDAEERLCDCYNFRKDGLHLPGCLFTRLNDKGVL